MTRRPSRAATSPRFPHAGYQASGRLFDGEAILQIAKSVAAQNARLHLPAAADIESIADCLDDAFGWATAFALLEERSTDAQRNKPLWFRHLIRDSRRLIEALGITPEQCMDLARPLPADWGYSSIWYLKAAAADMPGR